MKKVGLLLIIAVLVLLTACATLGGLPSRFGFGKEQGVGGKGVIVKFVESPENNEQIPEGIPFGVRIEVENYVVSGSGLAGEICLRDDLTDNFGGVTSDQCRTLNLPPATQIESRVSPTAESYSFGPYSYRNLQEDLTLQTKLTAEVKYEVESRAGTTACAKRPAAQSPSIPSNCGQRQNLKIQQPDLPLKISSISASPHSASDTEVNLLLEITISKSSSGQVVTRGNVIGTAQQQGSAEVEFEVLVNNQAPAVCQGVANNRVIIRQSENQKVIKCSARLLLDQDYIQAPITIRMGYGFIQPVDGPTIKLIKEEVF